MNKPPSLYNDTSDCAEHEGFEATEYYCPWCRIVELKAEQTAWRKFTDEANNTLNKADERIAELEGEFTRMENAWRREVDMERRDKLDAKDEVNRLNAVLDRLGSSEAFDIPRAFSRPQDDELIARMEYARNRRRE